MIPVTLAEQDARRRLANRGVVVGSDLHLCEMLLAQIDRARDGLFAGHLVDWVYLHATEGDAWPSSKTKAELIAKAAAAPTQADADAMKAAAPALHANLRQALREIIDTNKEFRAGLPTDWEGDPLQDVIEAAEKLL